MAFVHQRSVALPLPSCGNPRRSPDIAKCTFRATVSLTSVSDQLGTLVRRADSPCVGSLPLSPLQVLGGFGKLGSGLQRVMCPRDSHAAEGQRLRHSHCPGHTFLCFSKLFSVCRSHIPGIAGDICCAHCPALTNSGAFMAKDLGILAIVAHLSPLLRQWCS